MIPDMHPCASSKARYQINAPISLIQAHIGNPSEQLTGQFPNALSTAEDTHAPNAKLHRFICTKSSKVGYASRDAPLEQPCQRGDGWDESVRQRAFIPVPAWDFPRFRDEPTIALICFVL